jgi:uncharacterized membrane protein
VKKLRASLPPGKTALALLVSHLNENAVLDELHRFQGAELVQTDVSPHLEHALRDALAKAPRPSPRPSVDDAGDDDDDLPISQYAR